MAPMNHSTRNIESTRQSNNGDKKVILVRLVTEIHCDVWWCFSGNL